jgi:hypothetical protein
MPSRRMRINIKKLPAYHYTLQRHAWELLVACLYSLLPYKQTHGRGKVDKWYNLNGNYAIYIEVLKGVTMKSSNFYSRLHRITSQIIILVIKQNAYLVILFLINKAYSHKHKYVRIKKRLLNSIVACRQPLLGNDHEVSKHTNVIYE